MVALLAACAAPYSAPSATSVWKSVVKVDGADDIGSGVAVGQSKDGHTAVLTAYHVVKGETKLTIHGLPATVLSVDKAHDLALLDVPVWIPSVDVLPTAPIPGEPEVTVGFPLGLEETATPGFMGEPNVVTKAKGLQAVSGAMWEGNSGGAIFVYRDGKWMLAGIADAIAVRGQGTPFEKEYDTIGLCVPSDVIQGFLSHIA